MFDHPNLSVAAASGEHLLAMKLAASRGADTGDIRLLLDHCGCTSIDDVESLFSRVFVGESLSDRARLLVEDLLESRR